MDKMKRAERMVAVMQVLMSKPNMLIPLTLLAERFGAAKSTISEDLLAVKESMRYTGQGRLETVSGAAGGVRYIPEINPEEANEFLVGLADRLSSPDRVLAGGFLYMTDLLYDPAILRPLGLIFAGAFREKKPEVIVTIETKGIPLALVAAEALGLPMIIIRHGNKVTEGTAVSINYVSGSSKRIQSMSLGRRALEPGRKVLLIDDFMKAGGTALGMMNLMKEFEADVVGIGVLMETPRESEPKLVDHYMSLLQLRELDPYKGVVRVIPQEII
ncbi:pur operon repressor [Desulfitobacterium sp. THU1]|uniref:pur operon repressor n=1 Tax=Desulfitobacterium sp. THU1 TaxID=3138072 RepID=UPI00311F015A